MDERRLKKIERVLAIQQKMHKLAEWKLAALDRERAAVAENRERLVGALNADGPLHGVFVEAMARRLALLARQADRLAADREAQSRRLTEAGLEMKRTERLTGKAQREYRERLGKRDFQDLLEVLVKGDDASLP